MTRCRLLVWLALDKIVLHHSLYLKLTFSEMRLLLSKEIWVLQRAKHRVLECDHRITARLINVTVKHSEIQICNQWSLAVGFLAPPVVSLSLLSFTAKQYPHFP